MHANSQHLVIVDFSGTLSRDTVLFGRDEELTRALRDSGLWQSGLNSLDIFWQDVIAPTWAAGATSAIGYIETLTNTLTQRLRLPEEELRRCVAAFAANYFKHSTIHPAWIPILQRLHADPAFKLVIATDHYAEATELIRVQLAAIGISNGESSRDALIVNSADIGAFKTERAFWEHVRARCINESFRRISVIDDFGANESQRDSYAAETKIAKRQAEMAALITEIFHSPVEVFPFKLSPQEDVNSDEFIDCVARTATFIMR